MVTRAFPVPELLGEGHCLPVVAHDRGRAQEVPLFPEKIDCAAQAEPREAHQKYGKQPSGDQPAPGHDEGGLHKGRHHNQHHACGARMEDAGVFRGST